MNWMRVGLLAVCGLLAAAVGAGQTAPAKHFVVYLPFYKPADMAAALANANLAGVTEVDIAFVGPPLCKGVCTAASDLTISADQHTDADVDAVVRLAHAKGIRVLASIGGGGAGPSDITQFYNVGLSGQLVAALTKYVRRHKLDGVDADVEIPDSMGAPYADFIAKLAAAMHAEGKLLSCATAKYIANSVPDATLQMFDFVGVMVYSNVKDAQDALTFFQTVKHVPSSRLVLGVGFFGEERDGVDADYGDILKAYPNAYRVDSVGGGMLQDGAALRYAGEETMRKETQLASEYGGVLVWQLLGDAPPPHSLMDVIRTNLGSSPKRAAGSKAPAPCP